MSKEIRKILKKNLYNLFEDYGFEDMEVAFGVEDKDENLSDAEKKQFDKMENARKDKKGTNLGKAHVQSDLDKVHKDSKKDTESYYKDAVKKISDYQNPNQEAVQSRIGEAIDAPKRNWEEDEDFMYNGHMGTGMTGLRYDDEETENYERHQERMENLNSDDETYEKLKKYGEDYKEYKYGDKYDEVEDEYQETPRVRTTQKENVMKYSDVIKENIFKTKGKIISEEQVLKVANKVPERVRVDETVFAITDGENYYRLIWEEGEPTITHHKNVKTINEDMERMKNLWNFKSQDTISTKKNISESNEDIFRDLLKKSKNKE